MIEAAVVAGLNHLLNQADWARRRLAVFAGRQACVAMPPWRLYVSITDDGFLAAGDGSSDTDVDIQLPADAPLRAAQGVTKVFEAARIEGNAQFAAELSDVMKRLRWDYEEDLSRLFGDIAAHRIAGGLARFADFQKHVASRAVALAAAKGLLLAHGPEMQAHERGISEVHRAIEAAEKRLLQLSGR